LDKQGAPPITDPWIYRYRKPQGSADLAAGLRGRHPEARDPPVRDPMRRTAHLRATPPSRLSISPRTTIQVFPPWMRHW